MYYWQVIKRKTLLLEYVCRIRWSNNSVFLFSINRSIVLRKVGDVEPPSLPCFEKPHNKVLIYPFMPLLQILRNLSVMTWVAPWIIRAHVTSCAASLRGCFQERYWAAVLQWEFQWSLVGSNVHSETKGSKFKSGH